MPLVRWTPMGNLQSFQHEMNRMFNEFFHGGNDKEASSRISTSTRLSTSTKPTTHWSLKPSCRCFQRRC